MKAVSRPASASMEPGHPVWGRGQAGVRWKRKPAGKADWMMTDARGISPHPASQRRGQRRPCGIKRGGGMRPETCVPPNLTPGPEAPLSPRFRREFALANDDRKITLARVRFSVLHAVKRRGESRCICASGA